MLASKEWWKVLGKCLIVKDSFVRFISWKPLIKGCFKLNVDGSVRNRDSSIAAADVLRNHDFCWLEGFIYKISVGCILEAELWGLLEGLKFAWATGVKEIMVEFDSLKVVKLVNGTLYSNHPCFNLIQEFCSFLNAD
ncbi:hypothetical protein ACOSQ3_033481 [Xanthoceras sorbifolium]